MPESDVANVWFCINCLEMALSDKYPCAECDATKFIKGENPKGLTLADYREFVADANKRAPRRQPRLTRWLQSLLRATEKVAADGGVVDADTLDVFWIRLWSVRNELVDQLEGARALRASAHPWQRHREFVKAEVEVLDNTEAIAAALSTEEAVYLDYRRQCAAHLEQSAYRLGTKGDGKGGHTLKNSRNFKNLGAEFTLEEIDTVIAALDYRHGSEALVAKSIAKRILPMVRAIAHAQERVLLALRAL
jgi:hypothetical protein